MIFANRSATVVSGGKSVRFFRVFRVALNFWVFSPKSDAVRPFGDTGGASGRVAGGDAEVVFWARFRLRIA